jgi:hypothetical protein
MSAKTLKEQNYLLVFDQIKACSCFICVLRINNVVKKINYKTKGFVSHLLIFVLIGTKNESENFLSIFLAQT